MRVDHDLATVRPLVTQIERFVTVIEYEAMRDDFCEVHKAFLHVAERFREEFRAIARSDDFGMFPDRLANLDWNFRADALTG